MKQKLTLGEKIERNIELLSTLREKDRNLQVQIDNLSHKIENQKRALQVQRNKKSEEKVDQLEKSSRD